MIDERGAEQRWRIAVLAVGGLLVAIALIGVVGVVINRNIHQTVEGAITFDRDLEDRGDDLRVAVLEVRHYHRDLLLNNPDPTRIELWRSRYDQVMVQIGSLDQLLSEQPETDLPQVAELRQAAVAYHDEFAAALQTEVTSTAAFRDLATDLLVPIDRMERIAISIDRAVEERAAASYQEIDDATNTGTLILGGVILGLGAMGAVFAYAVLRLVQDQRRLVAAEQAAAARMAEASLAKTNFIADASHELRTPLTVLRGNAEIGLNMAGDPEHREILSDILTEATRMSRLVDDLLFLARSDASTVPLDIREVDARALADGLVSRAEMLARERGAALTAAVDAEGTVHADTDRVEQAVLVLVDNAAKYGPAGGPIDLAARTADGRLVIEVADRGPGIPPDQLERVFERFYRASGEGDGRRSASGVGLGLSIAAAIVAGHRGSIQALPRDGGGTLMRLSLARAGLVDG
jgi:two-component system sensor histidine kinase VicK